MIRTICFTIRALNSYMSRVAREALKLSNKKEGPDNYQNAGTISTAAGARTSLFIPELSLFCLAVPHRGSQPAEIRIFSTSEKAANR